VGWKEELTIIMLGLLGPWAGLAAWLLLVGDLGWG
jgi:hypothetical protein